jgi:uncharacterized protein (TIGR03437 family)
MSYNSWLMGPSIRCSERIAVRVRGIQVGGAQTPSGVVVLCSSQGASTVKNMFLAIAAFLALFSIQPASGQTPSAVTNGASFVVDEVAPGSIAAVFGTNLSADTALATTVRWPTTLAGTTLYGNGMALPLYYVSPTQIDFQAPSNALGGLSTNILSLNVVVTGRSAGPSSSISVAVSTAAPGIFVSSNGWAVVQNQDYSLNTATNPAAVGSYVTAYLTGTGPVDNSVADGAATPVSPLSSATLPFSATIGDVSASVIFLGLSPGYVGLAQANVQIPNLAPGTYPLVITVGGAVGNSGLITVSGGTLSPQYVLASVMGDGVSGSPATASPAYAVGSIEPYTYAPVSGFSTAVVEVDGALAPPSGSVTMSADHWLWVFGQPLTGTDFAGYITAPNNPVVIPYPQFYANPSSLTVRVTDPYCAIQSNIIAYPQSYLGSFPMPPVTGAPLPSSILRGVEFKDYWFTQNSPGTGNPSRNPGCSSGGTMQDAFTESVARATRLGSDHVSVVNIAVVVDATSAVPVIDALNNGQGIPESDLAFMATTATASGMDLWLDFEVSSDDEQNVALNTSPTQQWMAAFLDAWTAYVVQQATLAQKYGVKSIMINWGTFYLDITPYQDIYASKLTAALSQVRNVFSGTVRLYNIVPTPVDPSVYGALYNGVDWIQIYPYSPLLTADENQNLSFGLVKQKFKEMFGNVANDFAQFSKPLVLDTLIQSHRNFLQVGWIEDTPNCANGCIETTLQTDFSVQAIAYEALLEAVKESGLNFASFDTIGYWWTDTILPDDTFPNIAQSVRNKPAEAILQRWFAK